MKEERIHKVLLRVAIVTFSLGVVVSVIVTGTVMGIIYHRQLQEFDVSSTAVSDGEESSMSQEDSPVMVDQEGVTDEAPEAAEEGRGISVEMVPEILAGGRIATLADEDERWYLKLVNHNHPLAPDFLVELAELPGGHFVDHRIQASVLEMLESARNQGMDLIIVSSFRSYEDQVYIFNNMMHMWIGGGYSPLEAFLATQSIIAVPGHSEHQLGLALDIVSAHHQVLDESQSQTPEGQWLRENSWRYGFVVRYLEDKTHLTGIFYEPWHFRYVGREAAQVMWENNLVLEEFLLERYFARH